MNHISDLRGYTNSDKVDRAANGIRSRPNLESGQPPLSDEV
jgi:hypothetical protein